MSTLSHTVTSTATRVALVQACAVIAATALAGLAGLAGLFFITSTVGATPQADSVAQPLPSLISLPTVQAGYVTAAGTTVPAASAVFAGRTAAIDVDIEEAAPPF